MMKKIITAVFAAMAVGLPAFASPSPEYDNTGTVTNSPVIDAIVFENSGLFEALLPELGAQTLGGANLDTSTPIPYFTRDTLYYTNLAGGTMFGMPGFLFETVTAGGTNSARSFFNEGPIVAIDTPTAPEFPNFSGTTFFQSGTGIAYPSEVLISASNVFNGPNGSIIVGADGLLEMFGTHVANINSILVAGDLTGDDPYDLTALDQDAFPEPTAPGSTTTLNYFIAPPTFFDLWWGVTNITGEPGLLDLGAVAQGAVPAIAVETRGEGVPVLTNFSGFATYIYTSGVEFGTNVYYNIVCQYKLWQYEYLRASQVYQKL